LGELGAAHDGADRAPRSAHLYRPAHCHLLVIVILC
jgi:hypothetical protein